MAELVNFISCNFTLSGEGLKQAEFDKVTVFNNKLFKKKTLIN